MDLYQKLEKIIKDLDEAKETVLCDASNKQLEEIVRSPDQEYDYTRFRIKAMAQTELNNRRNQT